MKAVTLNFQNWNSAADARNGLKTIGRPSEENEIQTEKVNCTFLQMTSFLHNIAHKTIFVFD